MLAGGVRDETPAPGDPPVVRYQFLRALMSQDTNLPHGFAKTANCAFRRSAFEAAGGFAEGIPAGEDADLCFRLRDSGWNTERREQAAVVHRSRRTLRALVRQIARHGGGLAWMDRRYPGSFPARRWPGLALWAVRRLARGAVALARRDSDAAIVAVFDAVTVWAAELGRLGRNRTPRAGRAAARTSTEPDRRPDPC
jgi:GT2 family glycosyltransferase